MSKNIVSIDLGPSNLDCDLEMDIFGDRVHVRFYGTDGNLTQVRSLIAEFDNKVDAIALSDMTIYFRIGHQTFVHKEIKDIAQTANITPVLDGVHIKHTFDRWALSYVAKKHPGIFNHKSIFFLSGIHRYGMAQVLGKHTNQIVFGDPIFHWNLPFILRTPHHFERYARLALPLLCRRSYSRFYPVGQEQNKQVLRGEQYFDQADIIVGESDYILRYAPKNLRGKIVITSGLTSADVEELKKRGIESFISMTSLPIPDFARVDAGLIEAIFTSFMDLPKIEITDDNYLDLVPSCGLEPKVNVLNKGRDVTRFAHVIHPLSMEYIFSQPQFKYLRVIPHRIVERLMARIKPRYLSRIRGAKSATTGREVEGYLISLGATPREFMRRSPEFAYKRLILASRMAQRFGAQIMGLGAFTKVVGDAGITVAFNSDIAVTSGNSLTVAATLEAAKQAVVKMGGRTDQGRAVIVGATGAIGSVCARLIAPVCTELVLIAPRPEKLIPLKKTINTESPGAGVFIATKSNPYLPDADLVVTTTSAFGQKVVDVSKLKPGCVVCDVASPHDLTEDDAKLRPDVLIIEAGEIQLPGKPDVGFYIGLPPGIVHACLAEAALLAMEGRFENYTLGRNIEMEKVKEIYRLFKKHGLKLAGLRSFGRYMTDEEIARKRELADALRQDKQEEQS